VGIFTLTEVNTGRGSNWMVNQIVIDLFASRIQSVAEVRVLEENIVVAVEGLGDSLRALCDRVSVHDLRFKHNLSRSTTKIQDGDRWGLGQGAKSSQEIVDRDPSIDT